jgi:hypothetical protein
MNATGTNHETAQLQLRAQMQAMRLELNALQARLEELARENAGPPPPAQTLHTDFRIVTSPEAARQEAVQPRLVAHPSLAKPVDPHEVLHRLPRGAALFVPELFDGRSRNVALLVRADSNRVAQLGEDAAVEFRAALFPPAAAAGPVVPVLFRIGPAERDNVYEAWANEYAAGIRELFEALAAQEHIAIYFYGDSDQVERVLRVPNDLRAFAGEALAMTGDMPPLPPDALHQARQVIYRQYPTVQSLWKVLKG